MAEPTNIPAGDAGGQEHIQAPATPGADALSPWSAPVLPTPQADYRPLSLIALFGFVVSILWAVILLIMVLLSVILGGPVALLRELLLFPLVGLILSAVGWAQIQRSEGTQAGAALARWGLLLCLVTGLGYGAYLTAVWFAARQQSDQVTQEWFNRLRGDRVETAFLLTLPPDERPPEDARTDYPRLLELEARYAGGAGGTAGPLAQFRQHFAIRHILQGGETTQVEFQGIDFPVRTGNTYIVQQYYRVRCPEYTYYLKIPAQGKGKQWHLPVILDQMVDRAEPTELGKRLQQAKLWESSGRFAGAWLTKLRPPAEGPDRTTTWLSKPAAEPGTSAWLDTLPPAKRKEALERHLPKCFIVCAVGSVTAGCGGAWPAAVMPYSGLLADAEMVRALCLPGYVEFRQGSQVQADERFLAVKNLQTELPNEVKEIFRRPRFPTERRVEMALPGVPPRWKQEQGQLQVEQVVAVHLPPREIVRDNKKEVVEGVVEGVLVLETNASALDGQAPVWRVVGLRLLRGRLAAPASNTPPGM